MTIDGTPTAVLRTTPRVLFLLLLSQTLLCSATSVNGGGEQLTMPSSNTRLRHRTLQQQQQQQQEIVQQYSLLLSSEIRERVLYWKNRYSNFVRVTTAQEAYGLPAAGTVNDCPFDHIDSSSSSFTTKSGCLNYIVTIQDYITHPEGSDSSKRLPEVLWSGEVHGNERVGPTAVLEAAQLLLNASACEALPRVSVTTTTTTTNTSNELLAQQEQLKRAKACRAALRKNGIDDAGRKWLARLVATRRIVIVPTANALGYYRKVREEGLIDPNRDFPYDIVDPAICMQSIAARTLNEVFRQHLFQLSLTFHGGMEVIGYEWGATSKLGGLSPDDTAQNQIAAAYSHYGGGWKQSPVYNYGDMNSIVYDVQGGMEDWAYAGSWDPSRVVQCQPYTFGGYPKAKTTYDSGTLRAFNILVETSNDKTPAAKSLGTSQDILMANSTGTGHVSRNMRLALLSAELVEPYVSITGVNNLALSDDIVPQSNRNGRACQNTKLVRVSVPATTSSTVSNEDRSTITVKWTVGGSLTVDDTQLWYAKWSDIPTSLLNCKTQPTTSELKKIMKVATPAGVTSGKTRFSPIQPKLTPFTATFDVSSYLTEMKNNNNSNNGNNSVKLVVLALAKVDQNWKNLPTNVKVLPKNVLHPQSHVVNARTNSSWYYSNSNNNNNTSSSNSIVKGRLYWFSMPLTIELLLVNESSSSSLGNTVELSKRVI